MKRKKIQEMSFASIYSLYLAKIQKKSRTKEGLHCIITWLTGYDDEALEEIIKDESLSFETFFNKAPKLHDNRKLITGSICGIKVEEMEEGVVQEIRYLDKLVDELAKGKAIERIMRKE